MHRLLRYLGAYSEPSPWRTVGEVVDAPVMSKARTASSRVALTPSGQRVSLDGEGPEVLELTEQGFYEIRAQGRDADPAVVVASNVDLAESDMTPMDPKEVAAAAMGRAGDRVSERHADAADRRGAGRRAADLVVPDVRRDAVPGGRDDRGQSIDGVG